MAMGTVPGPPPDVVAAAWLTAAVHGDTAAAWAHTSTGGRLALAVLHTLDTGISPGDRARAVLGPFDLADRGPAHPAWPEFSRWHTARARRHLDGALDDGQAVDDVLAELTWSIDELPVDERARWGGWARVRFAHPVLGVNGDPLAMEATGAGWRYGSPTGSPYDPGPLRRRRVELTARKAGRRR